MRILLIKGNALAAFGDTNTLEQAGYDVVGTAYNIGDAVRLASSLTPDLLLVSLRLASGSGIDALEKIRSFGSIPTLFVSGDPDSCRRYGRTLAIGCLHKPYTPADLLAAVRAAGELAVGRSPSGGTVPDRLELYS